VTPGVPDQAEVPAGPQHRSGLGGGELVVIDEWETAEQFQSLFEGNAKIAKITELVGVTGPPAIAIYNEVEAPGQV
jgi:hypothetical protein